MRLSRTAGPSYNVNETGALEIKRTLIRLGLYSVPSYGLTPYPDQAMFGGIKAVQRRLGLWPANFIRRTSCNTSVQLIAPPFSRGRLSNRTDHVLPTAVISSVSDIHPPIDRSGQFMCCLNRSTQFVIDTMPL